jgi:hypothetical protein
VALPFDGCFSDEGMNARGGDDWKIKLSEDDETVSKRTSDVVQMVVQTVS